MFSLRRAHLNQFGLALEPWRGEDGITDMPPPPKVYLACAQQAGPEAKPTIRIGQQVDRGQQVAICDNGLALHASIAGTLIEQQQQTLANGRRSTVLVIERDGPDDLPPRPLAGEQGDEHTLPRSELISRLLQAGLVGMGGAAFPTAIKAAASLRQRCAFLLLNGSECEPQMSCDHALLSHHADRVLQGLALLQRICGAKRTAIALLQREARQARTLQQRASSHGLELEVYTLPNRYSMGCEKVLLQACFGREVPVGKLPIDIGALVFNVATSAAVADALASRQPLTSRIITLAGRNWRRDLHVRIGTRLDDLLAQLSIDTREIQRIIVGGPMMGAAFPHARHPVLKSTTGFTLLTRPQARLRPTYNCMRCGDCLPVCPVNLQPALLFQLLSSGQDEEARQRGLASCVECGACSAVCPSGIPLAHSFRVGKAQLRQRTSHG